MIQAVMGLGYWEKIYSKSIWGDSTDDNIYESSVINNYLNETFSILFDTDIKNIIKQVKIPYVNGTGSSGFVASGTEGLSVKIFCCLDMKLDTQQVILQAFLLMGQSYLILRLALEPLP